MEEEVLQDLADGLPEFNDKGMYAETEECWERLTNVYTGGV